MKQTARSHAGNERVRIQIVMVGELGNTDSEAALVQKVIARDALALVVEPVRSSDSELSRVISDARDRGLPVVLIGRPLDTSTSVESKAAGPGNGSTGPRAPLVQVLPEPFKSTAPGLVAAAINNARNAKFTPESGAFLMINTASDPLAEDRAQALRDALHDVGITTIEEVRFQGDHTVAKEKLSAVLPAHPKIGMVFSTDHIGLASSFQLLEKVGEQHMYVVAGYTGEESSVNMANNGEFAAAAIFVPERLIRKAIASAASLARGEKLAERVEVPVPLHVSPRPRPRQPCTGSWERPAPEIEDREEHT